MGQYTMDSYTVSLLHFDGGITDESGKVWAAVNSAATSTTQSKYGGSSLKLNGVSQYLTTPATTDFNFGTQDFTVDWWEYRTSNAISCPAFVSNVSAAYQPFAIGMVGNANANITFYSSNSGTSWDIANNLSMGAVILNTWTHYALCRSGNTFYTFQNGVLQSTFTSSLSIPNATAPGIGIHQLGDFFPGYIDEFRVSKGIARWTSDFTPGESTPAPTNLVATAGDTKITLSWSAVSGATGYNVKRSTTAGGPYTTIASNVTGTSYEDDNVVNGTTYYYVVTVIGANGESANSNEASATPKASSKAILAINMEDGRHEYQMPQADIDAFINWYNAKAGGTGSNSYVINKSFNLGPFASRKDYLVFDQIINFEVMAYQG